MKILAFAASNSRKSINKQLIAYSGNQLNDDDVELLDINDYEMPIYSADLEAEHGIPDAAKRFLDKIATADALLISYAEHNGSYTVAYKNLFDWASRVQREVYQGKSIVMLATSPGGSGAASVLRSAVESAVFFDGHVVGSFSLPKFYENFDSEKGELVDEALQQQLVSTLEALHAEKEDK